VHGAEAPRPEPRRRGGVRSIRGRLLLGLSAALATVLLAAGLTVRDTGREIAALRRSLDAAVEQRARLTLSSDATMRFVALAQADLLAPAVAADADRRARTAARAAQLAATADSLRRALLADPELGLVDRRLVERIGARQGAVEVRLAVARAFHDVGRSADAAREAVAAAATLDSLVEEANGVAAAQDQAGAAARRRVVARMDAFRHVYALALLLASMVAAGLAWVTVRAITDPLRRLMAHAHALSRGDFALRTDVRPLADEFAALGVAMNRASAALDTLQAQLTHQAEHDPLTGLANRARFRERAVRALAEARAAGAPWRVAVLAVDLDGFKAVNDRHGHAAGDQVLVETGARLLSATRGSDVVARLGGDEFALLLDHVRAPGDAALVAGRIVDAVAAAVPLDMGAALWAAVGASVGVALGDHDLPADPAAAYVEMARRADVALYEAKARGKRQFVFYEDAGATAGYAVVPMLQDAPGTARDDGSAVEASARAA
jgi:diguanylate cyclase (GGDEF)-like protein